MPGRKRLNERMFDKHTEKADYLLGIFFSCYMPCQEEKVMVRSSDEGLIALVKKLLRTNYKIYSPSSTSWLQLNAPHMRSRLEELGLDKEKEEREFPDIPEENLHHFVRGFLDARAHINIDFEDGEEYMTLQVHFKKNTKFLGKLHEALVKHAKVEGKGIYSGKLKYDHNDAVRIYNFIYRDFKHIGSLRVFHSAKKRQYIPRFKQPRLTPKQKYIHERAKKIEGYVRLGYTGREIAEKMGYSAESVVSNTYYRGRNKTMISYKKEFFAELEKKIRSTFGLTQIVKDLGYESAMELYESYERFERTPSLKIKQKRKLEKRIAREIERQIRIREPLETIKRRFGFDSTDQLQESYKKFTRKTIAQYRANHIKEIGYIRRPKT